MRSMTVQVGGPVNVVDYGGSGRPIVLVHGLGGSLVNWHAVGPGLTPYGHVTALDLIGFGWTPPAGRSSSIRSNRDLLIDYLEDHVGEPAVVIGNSMGGFISMLTAAKRPDLVDRLVLVCPALPRPSYVRTDPQVALFFVLYMIPGVAERVLRWRYNKYEPEAIVKQTLELCTVDIDRVPRDIYRQHEEMARARAQMPWATSAFLEAARALVPLLARSRRVHDMVAKIQAPTLVVQGEKDRLVDVEASRQLTEVQPEWDLEVMPDIGHVPMLECPDRFLAVVTDWLASDAPGRRAEKTA